MPLTALVLNPQELTWYCGHGGRESHKDDLPMYAWSGVAASYGSRVLGQSLAAEAYAQGVNKMVVGAVIHDGGRVLVVTRSSEDDFLPGTDELPSGGVDPGETLLEGLNRELREEIGFPVDIVDDGFLAVFDYRTRSGRVARQFTVSVPLGDREVRLSEEHSAHRWLAPDALATVSATPETESVLIERFRWAAANAIN